MCGSSASSGQVQVHSLTSDGANLGLVLLGGPLPVLSAVTQGIHRPVVVQVLEGAPPGGPDLRYHSIELVLHRVG